MRKIAFVFLFLQGMTACGSLWDYDAVQEMPVKGTFFDSALKHQYSALALKDRDDGSYDMATYFLGKAKSAAEGQTPEPDKVNQSLVEDGYIAPLLGAEARLNRALDADARKSVPDQAAMAQVSFDCMYEQALKKAEMQFQFCQEQFAASMAMVERDMLTPMPIVPTAGDASLAPAKTAFAKCPGEACDEAKPAADKLFKDKPISKRVAVVPAVIKDGRHLIYFAFGKADVRSDAKPVVEKAASLYKEHQPERMIVAGYADTAGPAPYNMLLSKWRAEAVAKLLKAGGIPSLKLKVEAYGETNLAVPTPDNTPKAANRRVVITLEKHVPAPGANAKSKENGANGKKTASPASNAPKEREIPKTQPPAVTSAPERLLGGSALSRQE